MGNSAWDIGAEAISSPIPIVGLAKGIFGRRQAKAQRGLQRGQAQVAVNQAERGQAEFEQNAPIEQQRLQQSLANRGVGNSSISTQDTSNLLATQARQRAAHAENVDLARRGKQNLDRSFKYARRMGPLNFYEAILNRTQQAMSSMAMPGVPEGMGGENMGTPIASTPGGNYRMRSYSGD